MCDLKVCPGKPGKEELAETKFNAPVSQPVQPPQLQPFPQSSEMFEDAQALRQAIRADVFEALAEQRQFFQEWLVSHERDCDRSSRRTPRREASSQDDAAGVTAIEMSSSPLAPTTAFSRSHTHQMPNSDVFDNPHVRHLQTKQRKVREGNRYWSDKIAEWGGSGSGADIRASGVDIKKGGLDTHLVMFERVADSFPFKIICTTLILSNSILIGIEVDTSMGRALQLPPMDDPAWFKAADLAFCALFCAELVVRLLALRLRFFCGPDSRWNVFDLLMVLSSVAEELLGAGSNMSGVRILRVLRLVRTLRIVRVVNFFRSLRLMVCCIFNSLMSLMWALLLLVLTMYLFGIVCVQSAAEHLRDLQLHAPAPEHVGPSAPNGPVSFDIVADGFAAPSGDDLQNEQLWGELHLQYSSIVRSMFTLLMAISGGTDWYDAVRPLMSIHPMYAVLFSGYVMFVLFGVLNVLSAVFVEHAFEVRDRDLLIQAETDRTRVFLTDMSELFQEADADGTGQLTWDEMHEYLKDERVGMYMATHQLDVSDINLMFKLLDSDGTGSVEMEEFVLGCFRLKGHARCLDMMRVFRGMDAVQAQLRDLQRSLSSDASTLQCRRSNPGSTSQAPGSASSTRA